MLCSSWLKTGVLAAVVLVGVTSCSSSSSDGDKKAFCRTNGEISAEVDAVPSQDKLPDAFKKVEGKFDAYVKAAPKDVKADAQTLVDAARKAIQSNDGSPFASDAALQNASQHVDSFCAASTGSTDSKSGTDSSAAATSSTTPQTFEPFETVAVPDGWVRTDVAEGISSIKHADNSEVRFIAQASTFDPKEFLDSVVTGTGFSNATEAKDVTIGGEPGFTREADFDAKGTTGRIAATVVQHGSLRYLITFFAPSTELFDKHADEVRAMLDSVAFVRG
jgi:hypothetical protein